MPESVFTALFYQHICKAVYVAILYHHRQLTSYYKSDALPSFYFIFFQWVIFSPKFCIFLENSLLPHLYLLPVRSTFSLLIPVHYFLYAAVDFYCVTVVIVEIITGCCVLQLHTFKGPHWCDFCANFLWGLIAQGVKCQGITSYPLLSNIMPIGKILLLLDFCDLMLNWSGAT